MDYEYEYIDLESFFPNFTDTNRQADGSEYEYEYLDVSDLFDIIMRNTTFGTGSGRKKNNRHNNRGPDSNHYYLYSPDDGKSILKFILFVLLK